MRVEFDNEYEKLTPSSVRGSDINKYCLFADESGVNEVPVIIDPHWHEWLEIIHIIEGTMTLECSGEMIDVNAGEVIVIGTRILHKIVGAIGNFRFQCLHINNGFIIQNINISVFLGKVFTIKDKEPFLECFGNVVKLIYKEDAVSVMKYKANLLLLLCHCVDESGGSGEVISGGNDDVFTRILFYVNMHLTDDISLTSLAQNYGYTPQYISTLFKKNLNSTFHTYLTKVRLDRANFMLFSSNEKIVDIAYACGFPSEHSFIAQFKKAYGMTPLNYKKSKVL